MIPHHDPKEMRTLLPALLRRPMAFACLPPALWDLVIRQARQAGVLARLCFQLDALGLLPHLPERPRRHLAAARTLALKHARDVRWEVACLRRALKDCDAPITLLKGAAYLAADLPPARGRLFSDIDILVPRSKMGEVERLLSTAGWTCAVKDPYDQLYYRRWTHQIPPLQHLRRRSVLDVHHTLVPPTSRTPVAAAALAFDSLALEKDCQLRILAPADMILHSAVHLFNGGEFDRGLRDLLDLSDLMGHFDDRPGFWPELVQRAETLGLTEPLYHSLRYLDRIVDMQPPPALVDAMSRWRPSPFRQAVLDALFDRALLPVHESCNGRLTGVARWVLYVRAHRLRMPLHLLLPHLARKSFRPANTQQNDDRRRRRAQINRFLDLVRG